MTAPNFENRTVWTGDNLDILRGVNSECVDLIYLDPPFNSNRQYAAPIGSKAAGAAFKDTWTLDDVDEAWHGEIADRNPAMYSVVGAAKLAHGSGMQSYLIMMAVRLLEMKRVLKKTGSIWLHCDPTASHYLKLLMDVVFGAGNFRNEIAWCYRKWGRPNTTSHFQRNHDVVLFYAAGSLAKMNPVYGPPSKNQERIRRLGYNAGTGRSGGEPILRVYDREKAQKKIKEAEAAGTAIYYVDKPLQGLAYPDYWDIPIINPMAKERTGYPTQKPLALLERVIKASSNEGDLVLDPFCGCATTLVAAERLNREWVGDRPLTAGHQARRPATPG